MSAPRTVKASYRKVVVSRAEKWALLFAVAVLLALGAAFGVAIVPKSGAPSAEASEGPGNPAASYRPTQSVEAWHDGRWYPAHIHSASGDRYFITYDDFSISWNEWVTARRLRTR